MAKVTFLGDAGYSKEVDVKLGVSVQEAAIQNGVDGIEAMCGGACSCSTCHVFIPLHWTDVVGTPGELESELLEMVPSRQDNSRLSCQIEMSEELDGLEVILPGEQVDVS